VKQPLLGFLASVLVIASSLAFISLFSFPVLAGWVSYILQCLIPAQIMVAILWKGEHPSFARRLRQPLKGVVLVLVTALAGVVIAPTLFYLIGEGIAPPTPMLIQFTVISVVTMFWLSVIWGGWPFSAWNFNPTAAAIATLAACYALTFVSCRLFLAPDGLFNAWSALTVQVTGLVVMFVMLNFDLWPLVRQQAVMRQPLLGLVWTAIALGGALILFELGTGMAGMDPVVFLTRVPIPFIFGTIIVVNMFQDSLFGRLTQPLKGIANTVASAVIGSALAQMYGALAATVTGPLLSGPPTYEFEIWVASSLLSVTFPFLIFFAEFFRFWPLGKD
jgi:hypothetical protein